jgi:hypothetical protein
MVETLTGTNRSRGLSYQELLKTDSKSVPASLKKESALDHTPLGLRLIQSQKAKVVTSATADRKLAASLS